MRLFVKRLNDMLLLCMVTMEAYCFNRRRENEKTVRLLLVGYVEWTVEERYQSCLGNNIVSIRQLFKKVQALITYRNTTKI